MPTPLIKNTDAKPYFVSRLLLTNFRNYNQLKLELKDTPVILTGQNGAGKTNILEAVSLLSPGKGLRKISLNEADIQSPEGSKPWSIAATVGHGVEETQIGTGRTSITDTKRVIKIDGDVVRGQAELAQAFSVMWQTPQMDGLFLGSSSDRRKFLDRLVYNFDPEHASRIYSYEYSMRERAKLLQNHGDPRWVTVLEEKMAERAVAVAIARRDTIQTIQTAILESTTAFPKAMIDVAGGVENITAEFPALQAEEMVRRQLMESRARDAASGRTHVGTHRSDFLVTHLEKNMAAAYCSTGEQKALLLSIILAEARAKAMWKNSVPVLLLDEVVAHLDNKRRASLFDELLDMRAQVWMTGTDVALFMELEGAAQFMAVAEGEILGSL